jgi:hypothetical protein
MVFKRTYHNPPPSSHTLSLYIVLETGKGRWVEPQRKFEGQQFTKLGRKYQHVWLYLQSVNSDKHMPQIPFIGSFFRWRHFAWVSIMYSWLVQDSVGATVALCHIIFIISIQDISFWFIRFFPIGLKQLARNIYLF